MNRLQVIIPALALTFLPGTVSTCSNIGVTGEGFPAYTCSDGRTMYIDLDGDGSDPDSIGRQIETDPEWIVLN